MNESVSRWQTEALKHWQQLSQRQRIGLALAGGAFVAALMFFVYWSQQVEYATVFSGLSQQDAGAVVAKLKEAKVPYQIADGGTTVKVPAPKVHEVRLQLASAGLPQGSGVGFELFDKSSFGLTDFAQKLNYQRALEGELARTINQLSAVEQSRVHIVIPKPELYTEKEKPATASVVLKLRPGGELQREQIRGICNLVASSVEGLKPDKITIIDAQGNILSDAVADNQPAGLSRATASQLDMQLSYQKSLEKSAQALLEQVLGHSKAAVRVHAVLDWDQVESNSETYSPNGAAAQVRSSHETTERYAGSGSDLAGGIPGTSSNIPSYTSAITTTKGVTTTAPAGYERTEKVNNYELSKVVARTIKAPGAVKRLSVAVLLDDVADDAQIQKVEKVVAAAVGLDATRGDSITVASMPFDRSFYQEQAKSLEEAQRYSLYFDLAKAGGGFIVLVVVMLFIRSLARSLRPKEQAVQPVRVPSPTITITKPPKTEEQQKRELIHQEIAALTRTKPAAVASLVRAWIDEK